MQSIWLARHGSRIDHKDPNWIVTAKRPFDPPLTERGFKQAEKLAQRLKNENIEHIISSPYLRTLQTSSVVAKTLQLPIKVEAGVGEYLSLWSFSQTPDFASLKEIQKEFPAIDTKYHSKMTPTYPEDSYQALLNRCKEILIILQKEISQNVLIVSHGSPVQAMTKALTGKATNMPYYCALSKIVRKDSAFSAEILADISHLQDLYLGFVERHKNR